MFNGKLKARIFALEEENARLTARNEFLERRFKSSQVLPRKSTKAIKPVTGASINRDRVSREDSSVLATAAMLAEEQDAPVEWDELADEFADLNDDVESEPAILKKSELIDADKIINSTESQSQSSASEEPVKTNSSSSFDSTPSSSGSDSSSSGSSDGGSSSCD